MRQLQDDVAKDDNDFVFDVLEDELEAQQEEEDAEAEAGEGKAPEAAAPVIKRNKYDIYDTEEDCWVDSRRLVRLIMRNFKEWLSKNRKERVRMTHKGCQAATTFSFGSAAAAPDAEGNEQSFGHGSFVALTFEAANGSYQFCIGKITVLVMIPAKGKKQLVNVRVRLNEVTETMHVGVTWLVPVPGQDAVKATRYDWGPATENVTFYKAKYIIAVLDVAKPTDALPYYRFSQDAIQLLSDWVGNAQKDDAAQAATKTAGNKRDRTTTQLTDEAGEKTVAGATTRTGRQTTKPKAT